METLKSGLWPFCELPDFWRPTSGFRTRGRGRSGCPGLGLGPLLAAPNGHRTPTPAGGGGGDGGGAWDRAWSRIAVASSRRGCHRKVQSRGRSEQRARLIFAVGVCVFCLGFTMGSTTRINPKRKNPTAKIRLEYCSDRPRSF